MSKKKVKSRTLIDVLDGIEEAMYVMAQEIYELRMVWQRASTPKPEKPEEPELELDEEGLYGFRGPKKNEQ